MEKVVIGCLGTYLECSGIHHLLVEEKIFGPGVVNSVMSGGNYVRGKRGMALIKEWITAILTCLNITLLL